MRKDREEIEAFALIAWLAMTPDQRAGCRCGMFPWEIREAAHKRGLDLQACMAALTRKAQAH